MTHNQRGEAEPSAADLAAIEAEWPLIEAELALLDAEIRALMAAGGPSPLDWRRLRRAARRVLAVQLRAAGASRVEDVDPSEAARRAWVTADRDSEQQGWRSLYNALYPPPDGIAGVAS